MAQVLQFPRHPQPKRTAKEAYIIAFMALMSDCKCDNCLKYRELMHTDPDAAERFLLGLD